MDRTGRRFTHRHTHTHKPETNVRSCSWVEARQTLQPVQWALPSSGNTVRRAARLPTASPDTVQSHLETASDSLLNPYNIYYGILYLHWHPGIIAPTETKKLNKNSIQKPSPTKVRTNDKSCLDPAPQKQWKIDNCGAFWVSPVLFLLSRKDPRGGIPTNKRSITTTAVLPTYYYVYNKLVQESIKHIMIRGSSALALETAGNFPSRTLPNNMFPTITLNRL